MQRHLKAVHAWTSGQKGGRPANVKEEDQGTVREAALLLVTTAPISYQTSQRYLPSNVSRVDSAESEVGRSGGTFLTTRVLFLFSGEC